MTCLVQLVIWKSLTWPEGGLLATLCRLCHTVKGRWLLLLLLNG